MHSIHFPGKEHTGTYPQTFLPFVKQTQELMLELQLSLEEASGLHECPPVAAAQTNPSSLLTVLKLLSKALLIEFKLSWQVRWERPSLFHRQVKIECFVLESFFFSFGFSYHAYYLPAELQKQHSLTAIAREKHEVEKSGERLPLGWDCTGKVTRQLPTWVSYVGRKGCHRVSVAGKFKGW